MAKGIIRFPELKYVGRSGDSRYTGHCFTLSTPKTELDLYVTPSGHLRVHDPKTGKTL